MATYKVRGESESGVESALPLEEGKLEVLRAVRIDPSVRADGPTASFDIVEDDLLEVELESGFVLWTTVDRLKSDTESGGTRAETDGLLLPVRYPQQPSGPDRGFVADAIQGLKVLGYDLPEGGARAVARKIEQQLDGDGEFFRISRKGDLFPGEPEQAADEPSLVLIHGTASATANAYAGLFADNSATWGEIYDHYEGRVYGFEHRTLSQNPLENALDFLRGIPEGAHLHLLTHSRGGLVGDLIAHGGVRGDVFDPADVERELAATFRKPDARRQLEHYQEFNSLIRAKAPRVGRYVRVGCPAAGTTLASGRLDVYLSILINLVRHIPGVGPFLAGLGELAAAVAKERSQPDVLPGLEAQMPKSAFLRLLNGSSHELESDLTVLAGDSEGLIKNLANLFYWGANDLVVDTRSMYGGAPRARRLWFLEENRHVTHVNYFRRFDTAQVVERGLLRADTDTSGFESRVPKGVARGHVDVGLPDENVQKPAVILIPGVMGSHLRVFESEEKSNRIWLDKSDLMKGRGSRLQMGNRVEPDGVLKMGYDDLRDYLVKHGIHVMPLAFDWRESLALAAGDLRELVQRRLAESSAPVHLLAHSMGGIVASLFIARHAATWKLLRSSGGRLVQAGTPNLGSYVIPRILTGEEKMVRFLAGIDFKNDRKKWAAWSSRFPGLLEMAPNFDSLDFSEQQTWKGLDVLATPRVTDLKKAEQVRTELADQVKKLADEGVLYVAGGPNETPIYDPEQKRIRFTMRGDGRVTWASGIPPGAPTWYVPTKHGSLLDHKSAFPGLRELVMNGTTGQLSTEQPPASSLLLRGEGDAAPRLAADREQVEFIPSSDDLEAAALGMDDAYGRGESGPPVPPCEVAVVHGDLRFVSNPVIVGHYRGDPIVHAESVLDWCLDGALRSRHQLDLYPGEVGTAEAVLKRTERLARGERGPEGAIVLGLGNVGELTSGGLVRSIEAGLLRYVQICRDRGRDTSSLKISALLVGSGEAGLTVAQIVEAFLQATGNANRALERIRTGNGDEAGSERALAFISRLEFIELYRDLALEALHSLNALPADEEFRIRGELETRSGGRRRARVVRPSGWWTRLSILSRPERRPGEPPAPVRQDYPTLTFTAFGERARVAVNRVKLQGPLVERFLLEAINDVGVLNTRPSQTLFELLLPPDLKAVDGRDLQLVLDEGSAVFPWELLIDRMSEESEPVGVGSSLLRQLRVEDVQVVGHPEVNQILVVGDPPSSLARLPGARKEAECVADLFERRGWTVLRQIRHESGPPGISASTVIDRLMNDDARILHLAGHGVYDPGNPMRSGMVLGGGADDEPLLLITPAEVSQMRLQPELVFINCCHLGRIEEVPPHRLAANLAAQFIRSGVKAVIAAGWPVDDLAATTFADAFYGSMLRGEDFGAAVKRARERTYEAHPSTNTWGAYQCYGDPGFRLMMDTGVRARATGRAYTPDEFVDAGELLIELGNLESAAKVTKNESGKRKIARRRDELRALAEARGWLGASGVLPGLARVHGELGEFEQAIDLLKRARGLEKGGVTLRDLEQAANYRARLGKERGSVTRVREAIAELKGLVRLHGETAERLSLLAGAHKRMAQLRTKKSEVRASLVEMTAQYARAAELGAANWDYPATNALLGVVLLGGPWTKPTPPNSAVPWAEETIFDERMAQLDAALRKRDESDFWVAVGLPDLALVKALAENKLAERLERIVARYRQAVELYGSDREIDSVVNQWEFAAGMARRFRSEAEAKSLSDLKTLTGVVSEAG